MTKRMQTTAGFGGQGLGCETRHLEDLGQDLGRMALCIPISIPMVYMVPHISVLGALGLQNGGP